MVFDGEDSLSSRVLVLILSDPDIRAGPWRFSSQGGCVAPAPSGT